MESKVYILLAMATVFNLVTVVCMKESNGMTLPWYSFGVVVSIVATQWLIAQALAAGGQIGFAVTAVVATVMVGAGVIGWVWYGEKLSTAELFGYFLAIAGVVIANLAKATSVTNQ